MANMTCDQPMVVAALVKSGVPRSALPLVRNLQHIHDSAVTVNNGAFDLAKLRERLDAVADDHNLSKDGLNAL